MTGSVGRRSSSFSASTHASVLAITAVLSAVLGAAVAYLPSSTTVAAGLCVGAGGLVWLGTRASTAAIGALLISLPLLILPFLPYLTSQDPRASYLRFVLAGAVIFGVALGVVRLRRRPLDVLGVLVLAFALYQVVLLAAGGFNTYSALRWAGWTIFIPVAFLAFSRTSERGLTVTALVGGALLIFGAILQVTGALPGDVGGLRLGGSIADPEFARRYTSFAGNPNDFGLLMLCLAAVLFALAHGARLPRAGRTTLLFGTLAAMVALLASSSRGAVLALIPVGAFVLYTVNVRRAASFLAIGLVAVAVIVASVPALEVSVRRSLDSIPGILGENDPSSTARLWNWKTRLEETRASPLWGAGYGGYAPGIDFSGEGVSTRDERLTIGRTLTVDNGALKLWLEEGLLGLMLFAAILGISLYRASRLARHPSTRVRGLIAGSVLAAAAFRGLSVDLFDISPWNYVIWLAVGLAAASPKDSEASPSAGSPTDHMTASPKSRLPAAEWSHP